MITAHHIKKKQISAALEQAPIKGKHELEPFKTLSKQVGIPWNILEDTEVDSEPEVHKKAADMWLCLEGTVTFTCGGELVAGYQKKNKDGSPNQDEWRGRAIQGGQTFELEAGDWLWIPADVPHKHACEKTARLVIIKIPAS